MVAAVRLIFSALVVLILLPGPEVLLAAGAASHHADVEKTKQRHSKKLLHEGGWAGAGLAAGSVAGPGGSAAVGVARYRKDLKAGGRRRNKAAFKIGAPIAIGAVAGLPGLAGYTAVEHRSWIKRHLF